MYTAVNRNTRSSLLSLSVHAIRHAVCAVTAQSGAISAVHSCSVSSVKAGTVRVGTKRVGTVAEAVRIGSVAVVLALHSVAEKVVGFLS